MVDDTIKQQEADFIMVLSSEMISDVVEKYLNDEMYKKRVKVVDTKPTESGYAFGICFDIAKAVSDIDQSTVFAGVPVYEQTFDGDVPEKMTPNSASYNHLYKRKSKVKDGK